MISEKRSVKIFLIFVLLHHTIVSGSDTDTDIPPTACNYSNIWNDVIFMLDASQATGDKNLADMWGLVQSITPWFNVQKSDYTASKHHVRMGIITYASKPRLLAGLGTIDQDDIYALDPHSEAGDYGTNMEDSIKMAVEQFNTSAHRVNSRMVIVIMATTYNNGNYNAPQKVASEFRQNGGIIVAFDYLPTHGLPVQEMQQIASPGYFIYSPDSTMTSLLDAQCDANSFCPHNFIAFTSTNRSVPTDGCYYAVDIQNNFTVAKHNCRNSYNNGSVSPDHSASQNAFLRDHYDQPTDFYIGLEFDSLSNQWQWQDGTALSGDYQPWITGYTPTDSSGGSCVFVAQGTEKWIQTDCRNSHYFTCRTEPCTPDNYCDVTQI